jgi:predicted phosphodiesterase
MSNVIKCPVEFDGFSVISVGCLHLGKEDKNFYRIFKNYVKENKCNAIVSGGDLTDAGPFRASSKASTAEMLRGMEKDYNLTREFISSTLPYCDYLYFIRGNHENRYNKAAESNEVFRNSLSLETYQKEWAPEAIHVLDYPNGEILKIGDAKLLHGRYWSKNHLFKHWEAYGPNTYYWHTHTVASESFVTNGTTNAPQVMTLGCGEKLLPNWMNGSPHKWVNCFQHWFFDKKGRYQLLNLVYQDKKIIDAKGNIWK